jgi:hypothetical protein
MFIDVDVVEDGRKNDRSFFSISVFGRPDRYLPQSISYHDINFYRRSGNVLANLR